MKQLFKEFGLVLENSKMKEDMGIEQLIFSRLTFDLTTILGFRESMNDMGELEPYTVVYTDTAHYCLDISYTDFAIIFHTEVLPLLEKRNEQR